jgi:hypothetical protein
VNEGGSPLIEVRDYAMSIALRFTSGNRDLSEDIASDIVLAVAMMDRVRPFDLKETLDKRWIAWRVKDRIKSKVYRQSAQLSEHDEVQDTIGAIYIARRVYQRRGDAE